MEKYKRHFSISGFIHNNYNELLLSRVFRMFALSMISLFVPIYLLQIGFSLFEIIIFESLVLTFSLGFHFLTISIIKKLGIKTSMIISYFLTMFFYLILYSSEEIIPLIGKYSYLVIIGIFMLTYTALFWMSYHFYFVRSTKKKEGGKKLGVILAVPLVLSIISPLIGGFLITQFSFKFAFMLSFILLGIGGVVLFFTGEMKSKFSKVNFKKIIDKKNPKKNALFFIEGISGIGTAFIWPILLFLNSVQLISIGILLVFSNALYALVSYRIGKLSDENDPNRYMKIGGAGHGLSIAFRAISKNIAFITGFQSIGGIFGGIWTTSMHTSFYKRSHKDISNSVMNREFYMHTGRIFMFLILMLLIYLIGISKGLISGMIFAGVATMFITFLRKVDMS